MTSIRIMLPVILLAVMLVALRRCAGRPMGELARRLSDIPTNALLAGTSGFEREGRDPGKGE